ncbi:hypothetical protein PRZ48_000498 [Zasmidium cellare]|uniref:Uncharacterized protein n=1 Tax=Zasmidium cellare TaxID=395010 RepID=A0ABR0EZ94_ZASCE|nr:hypothetical protein PRZ48_000498 [Zasmidium cellare]
MRGGPAAGAILVTVCGVFTAYTTLQPELQKQKEERDGNLKDFAEQHQRPEEQEKIISKAIMDDLREAKREATSTSTGGFAWGIRQALFGSKEQSTSDQPAAKPSPSQPEDRKDNSR